jgi:hypothetical protein
MRLLATRQDFTLIQGATDQTFCFQFCAKPFMREASGAPGPGAPRRRKLPTADRFVIQK